MLPEKERKKIEQAKKEWEEGPLEASLEKFGLKESPERHYSPLDIPDHDFVRDVGFPGMYPFTGGEFAIQPPAEDPNRGDYKGGVVRQPWYSGYGTAEDTRDFYRNVMARGWQGGPNVAFSLSTQCGYDSDHPMSRGEVGRAGVVIDTLRDIEVLYEAFTGPNDLDKIVSNWTINPLACVIMAMYVALAKKRGIPLNKLRGTPQNDNLKEILGRGTCIFPVRPQMRITRDIFTYCHENLPRMNTISILGYHIREAGASGVQTAAYTLSNAMEYVRLGINAGLEVDSFMPRVSFYGFGGSMEFFNEIALHRAARRMWAKIMKDTFKAKDPRSWILRGDRGVYMSPWVTTKQRPLNNLTRQVIISCVARCLSGGEAYYMFAYDEPLSLGHSLEAMQLAIDATRIAKYECHLEEVSDPLAGSYYVEWLTDKMEKEVKDTIDTIEGMGGAVAAIEKGYQQREIARNAYQIQREIETGTRAVIGVNKFVGENELEVMTSRLVPHPYDPIKREEAEERQLVNLAKVKRERDSKKVLATLKTLKKAAQDENANIMPALVAAVEAYATVGEMSDTLREVFGEYKEYTAI